jgi:hypothetical protein
MASKRTGAAIVAAGMTAIFVVAAVPLSTTGIQPVSAGQHMNTTTASSSMTNDTGIATDSATAVRVAVGGGNVTVQHYTFEPQMVEIDAGESVTW